MTETLPTCSLCGSESEELTAFGDQCLCENCIDNETMMCDSCGNRIWNEDSEGDSNCRLCFSCYDNNYSRCTECGRTIHNDEAYYTEDDEEYHDSPYCYSCYESNELNSHINGYRYKPSPVFHGEGIFYGIELEVDEGGEVNKNAEQILNIANSTGEHIYCKHDGSLERGFEIVTHPMTLCYHMKNMPWADVLSKAISLGYRSHQSGTCGIHIHVGRTAFGSNEVEQEAVIARILYFIEKNWSEMLKFCRRTEDQINRWASRYGYKNSPKEVLENAKDQRLGRYVCINLENYSTIEFRIFRGSLKLQTLLAALQMVDQICNVAILMSDDEFKAMTWRGFVANIGVEKAELINYLKQRLLNVNEPIVVEEDI